MAGCVKRKKVAEEFVDVPAIILGFCDNAFYNSLAGNAPCLAFYVYFVLVIMGVAFVRMSVAEVDMFLWISSGETCVLLGRKIPEDVEYAYLDYEPRKSAPIKGGATYSER